MRLLSSFRFFTSSCPVRCAPNSTVDPRELEYYNRHAAEWWDPSGPFASLLKYNGVRIPFIEKQVRRITGASTSDRSALKDVRILDVGCGGGFLSEGLAENGANVTGIDVSENCVKVGDNHRKSRISQMSEKSDMFTSLQRLQYICTTVESFREQIRFPLLEFSDSDQVKSSAVSTLCPKKGMEDSRDSQVATTSSFSPPDHLVEQFDVVVTSEVIEHVNNVESFFSHCADFVKPGGLLVITTPNRTPLSYLFVILLAEYVFRLIPKGTHFYSKFLKPREISKIAEGHGFSHLETTGTVYIPVLNRWFTEPTKWLTYMTAFQKEEPAMSAKKRS